MHPPRFHYITQQLCILDTALRRKYPGASCRLPAWNDAEMKEKEFNWSDSFEERVTIPITSMIILCMLCLQNLAVHPFYIICTTYNQYHHFNISSHESSVLMLLLHLSTTGAHRADCVCMCDRLQSHARGLPVLCNTCGGSCWRVRLTGD